MTTKAKTTDTVATAKAIAEEGLTHAQKGFEQAQATMQENLSKAAKGAEEFVAFSQGNVEAFVRAGQIWAAGVQDLGKTLIAATQASVDETVANAKALAGVKSVKEAIDLQTQFVKTAMEKAVADSQKLSETVYKLAEQAAAPLTERAQLAASKFSKAA